MILIPEKLKKILFHYCMIRDVLFFQGSLGKLPLILIPEKLKEKQVVSLILLYILLQSQCSHGKFFKICI